MAYAKRLICLAALSVQAVTAIGQPLQCEPLAPQKNALGYRLRGGYCEGLFVQDTSSSVRLKALVALSPAASGVAQTMRAVPLAPSGNYRIRVQSLDSRIHYQLDAIIPASGSFSWPAELIDRAALRRTDLAPLAWTDSRPSVYVPVALGSPLEKPPLAVRAIFESSVPVVSYVARLAAEQGGESRELNSRSALPATYLEFDLPAWASGRHTFWLRVRLLGEAEPEVRNWLLWLP